MLEITKNKNDYNYDIFNIKTDQGILQISFENNLDLYWTLFTNENLSNINTKEFLITKENYFIYDTFYNLYNAIKNKTPYSNLPYDMDYKNKCLKYYDDENSINLFKNNKVEWHSDNFDYDSASILFIEKKDNDIFSVMFEKSKNNDLFETFEIRFCNSGSRYSPFNVSFMNMYHKFQEYNCNYHQIHFEEYMYNQKKLERKLH